MNAVKFPEVNLDLGAGNNPHTTNLPVAICTNPFAGYEGVSFLFSCYKLTPEDFARINETGVIWIGLMAPKPVDDELNPGKKHIRGTQPPIVVQTENPFTEITPPYVAYHPSVFVRDVKNTTTTNAEPSASGENEKEDTHTDNDRVHGQGE